MKKQSILPSVSLQKLHKNQYPLSFEPRSSLRSKGKENQHQKALLAAKAKAIINKTKSFDSPELIMTLNDSIRNESRLSSEFFIQSFRNSDLNNKTFHGFSDYSLKSQLNTIKHKKGGFYAQDKERQKAIDLAGWVDSQMNKLKNKKEEISLNDVLDYKQTIINYGLGEIIQSVSRRCKEEGSTLKFIWDSTFNLFENLLNVLTNQIKKKDEEMFKVEEELNRIYLINLQNLKSKNQQIQKHLDLLYEKMAMIIKWNRSLKKDKVKQQTEKRFLSYQIQSYTSALESATSMLLTESKEPNCLHLAKKIIQKLYKHKNSKKRKNLKNQAHEEVFTHAQSYVLQWLKRYAFDNEGDLNSAVNLTLDEKFELMQMEESQNEKVDIYDYFQNYEIGVQSSVEYVDSFCQYEKRNDLNNSMSIGVGTKKLYYTSAQIQVKQEDLITDKDRLKMIQKSNKTQKLGSQKNQNHKKSSILGVSSSKNAKQATSRQSISTNKQNKGTTNGPRGKAVASKRASSRFIDIEQEVDEENRDNIKEERKENEKQYRGKREKTYENIQSIESSNQLIQKSRDTLHSILQWDQNQNLNQMDLHMNYETKQGRKKNTLTLAEKLEKRRQSIGEKYQGSQKNIPENKLNFDLRPLLNKKFDETYKEELKEQITLRKEEMIRGVVRRRSFYKPNEMRKNENQMIRYLFKLGGNNLSFFRQPVNVHEKKILRYFQIFNEKNNVFMNQNKAKNQIYTKNLFNSISNSIKSSCTSSIPKNKQFVNLTVSGLVKFISKLLYDTLRRIKAEKQNIFLEAEKVNFPLSVIMLDELNNKYGLREIAEKKLRDLLQKIHTFAPLSDRIELFYKLLGMHSDYSMISSEQLLIYMKCLVYFDTQKVIQMYNVGKDKDFSIERVSTNKQVVLDEIQGIVEEFFPENDRKQVIEKISQFLESKKSFQIDIEPLAHLLIEEFLKIKKERSNEYSMLWRNCQGNFFTNFYKILESSEIQQQKIESIFGQIFKGADLLDELNQKSISEQKFISICIKMDVPFFSHLQEKLHFFKAQFMKGASIIDLESEQSQQKIERIMKMNKMVLNLNKDIPHYQLIRTALIGYEIAEIQATKILNNLNQFLHSNMMISFKAK